MLIETVLDVVLSLVSALLGFLPALPALPAVITDVWQQVIDAVSSGLAVLGNWLYFPVVLPCVGIVVAANHFEDIYRMIGWFVSKIPFLNIKM